MVYSSGNKPIDGKMIKRRKQEDNAAGIELAFKRLRREMSDGIISIIGAKILSGEISIVQRKQKFLQHKSGTPQHESATRRIMIDYNAKGAHIVPVQEK